MNRIVQRTALAIVLLVAALTAAAYWGTSADAAKPASVHKDVCAIVLWHLAGPDTNHLQAIAPGEPLKLVPCPRPKRA